MSVVDVVEDLNALQELAQHETDPDRRRTLDDVRARLADRDSGAKVSEAAELLGVTPPTVRAWIKSGLLVAVPGARPARVDLLCLADVKRAVDLLRAHGTDRDLLAAVYRRLRDAELIESAAFKAGMADFGAGRIVPIGDDLREEMANLDRSE